MERRSNINNNQRGRGGSDGRRGGGNNNNNNNQQQRQPSGGRGGAHAEGAWSRPQQSSGGGGAWRGGPPRGGGGGGGDRWQQSAAVQGGGVMVGSAGRGAWRAGPPPNMGGGFGGARTGGRGQPATVADSNQGNIQFGTSTLVTQLSGYRPVQGGRGVGSIGGGRGAWSGGSPIPPIVGTSGACAAGGQATATVPDMQSLKISSSSSLSLAPSSENKLMPIKRPDKGGVVFVRLTRLLVNHFPVTFNSQSVIWHYDVDIKRDVKSGGRPVERSVPKTVRNLIREKLFSDRDLGIALQKTAYDGEKNIYSPVELPTGSFKVELSDGEDTKSRIYTFTIQLVAALELSKLKDYLSGKLISIPRDVLMGMDLVMKENPSRCRVSVGRSTYSREFKPEDDLGRGIAAFKGFQQSLKSTSQGAVLCLDYSVLAFRKRMPVIDFLREHVPRFTIENFTGKMKKDVLNVLKGLKVNVTHRVTKQKYTIEGLTDDNVRNLSFTLDDPEGKDPPKKVTLIDYFKSKYDKDIMYKDIPCLDVGKNGRQNYIPLEFCVMLEGQRYPKENLDKNAGLKLRNISLAPPADRMSTIVGMVRGEDSPCGGDILKNFEIGVVKNMTSVEGRVLAPPALKLATPAGRMEIVKVDQKCQWNITRNSLVEGRAVERWALIDFTSSERYDRLNDHYNFVHNLRCRCEKLGIVMEEPLTFQSTGMDVLDNVNRLRKLLQHVVELASRKTKIPLQIVVCVMAYKHPGYKYLKFVSETEIGILTQCCLARLANEGKDQNLANLGLKINAKLGGSNVELGERLPRFEGEDPVMFVGADVNHPTGFNEACPSIAAVVASVNWPAVTKYAPRIRPQNHRKEKIVNFGSMCLELVKTFEKLNKVKPKKIVVFRDGVSESQFEMVLNEELQDLKMAIYEENYCPTITLVVAQKRHNTRFFLENQGGDVRRNISPGTVVDTKVVHPFEYDFYLCSHYGNIGTSKPTHYYVLYDDHKFTSDQLQKLIYQLCFTFARCSKPVSLVPPVYYADLAAYRGRMYQEVLMERQPPPSASSSASHTSSSSSSAASFDDGLYKLHPELESTMFFV